MNLQRMATLAANLEEADRLAGRIMFNSGPGTNTSFLCIGPSLKRRSLVLFAPAAGSVTYSNDNPVAANAGIVLAINMGPIVLLREWVGDCIVKPWYAIYTSASGIPAWIETMDETRCYQETSRVNGVLQPWTGHK